MADPRIIHPGLGVDGFRLGMTRPEIWALTTSTIRSFLRGGAAEREDELMMHGVCVEYDQGRAWSYTVFSRMPSRELAPIMVLDEDVSGFTRDDVNALLQLHDLVHVVGYEDIAVPSLGLTFWFREGPGDTEVVEFVRVEHAEGTQRQT